MTFQKGPIFFGPLLLHLVRTCEKYESLPVLHILPSLYFALVLKGTHMEQVVLVNEQDHALGTMEKMEAHRLGALHRAFSIFIFNSKGEMLLQQRAMEKYHSGGLWTNACCSHPRPGEEVSSAANRRLVEELGFATTLLPVFNFVYKANFENGLIEHEFDHVYFGTYEGKVYPNRKEVMSVEFKTMETIASEIKNDPTKFTAWFNLAFDRVYNWWHLQHSR